MCFEGKIGKNGCPFQNQERTHDHTNVATLGDVRDFLPPLSPESTAVGERSSIKRQRCVTYFATQIIFFQGVNEGN